MHVSRGEGECGREDDLPAEAAALVRLGLRMRCGPGPPRDQPHDDGPHHHPYLHHYHLIVIHLAILVCWDDDDDDVGRAAGQRPVPAAVGIQCGVQRLRLVAQRKKSR